MDNQPTDDQKPQKWRWLLFATPAIVFVVMAMMLAKGLQYDPTKLPLDIKGQTFPEFRLPDWLSLGAGIVLAILMLRLLLKMVLKKASQTGKSIA